MEAGEQNNAISRQFFVHLPPETFVNLLKPGEVITQTYSKADFLYTCLRTRKERKGGLSGENTLREVSPAKTP